MLSNKEISQNFEVQINTLYNWRKSKPKLYRYLRNADYNFEQSKEINILLERFSREIKSSFTIDEILFFAISDIEANSINDVEEIEKLFLVAHHKELVKNSDLLFSIYDKLSQLGIVEKYIFYKRIHNLRAGGLRIDSIAIEKYFGEFLV